jgi:hypothetical protein
MLCYVMAKIIYSNSCLHFTVKPNSIKVYINRLIYFIPYFSYCWILFFIPITS